MRDFSVKDYCFSKPCVTGIVRFVRVKQRSKTPTRFRAGGFAAFSGNSDSISCRQHIFSDLISCNLWNAAPPSCADAAKFRLAFVQFGPPVPPAQQTVKEMDPVNSDAFSCSCYLKNSDSISCSPKKADLISCSFPKEFRCGFVQGSKQFRFTFVHAKSRKSDLISCRP